MSSKCRDELVGKRFLSVKAEGRLKVGKISEWEWRSGFIRAVSTRDSSNADFTALVEFDDTGWKSREYIKVHEVFQEFLVEYSLAWVPRNEPNYPPHTVAPWPALCYKPVVDKAELFQQGKRPVEFLSDRSLGFVDKHEITVYKEGDENSAPVASACPEVRKWVKTWTDYQDGQKILLTTPTVLLGYRVEVYRTEGTTQWYTAVIKSYNHATKNLTLTDDTVLEEHNEDPTLIQMHLIGDGVVDSILNGVDVGVAQRRRPRSTVTKQVNKEPLVTSQPSRVLSQSTPSSSPSPSNSQSRGGATTPAASRVTGSRSSRTAAAAAAAAVSITAATESVPSPSAGASSPTADTAGHKGASPTKNQKPAAAKRRPEPAAKSSRSKAPPPAGKKLKKSESEENLDLNPPVCKQTCNVLVKRIEEEPQRSSVTKEKVPRLREKARQSRKPPPPSSEKKLEEQNTEPTATGKAEDPQSPDTPPVCEEVSSKESVSQSETSGAAEVKSGEPEVAPPESVKVEVSGEKLSASPAPASEASVVSVAAAAAACEDGSKPEATVSSSSPVTPTISAPGPVVSKAGDGPVSVLSPSSCPPGHSQSARGSKHDHQSHTPSKLTTAGSVKPKIADRFLGTGREDKKCVGVSEASSNSVSVVHPEQGNEDMNFKKQILRARRNISPSPNTQTGSVSEGIDVNRSLTEQLAKRTKTFEQFSVNGDGKPPGSEPPVLIDRVKSSPCYSAYHLNESSPSLSKADFISERHSAFTCVQSSVARSNTTTPATEDRADSRASDGQLPPHITEDKRPGSRLDDIRSSRSSPGSSPLIVDRYEAVNPYRDPELMRKNPVQSNVPNILTAQHKMNQSSFPSVPPAVPGASTPSQTAAAAAAAAAFSGVPGVPPQLPARSLLSSLPSTLAYTSNPQLPPSMSPHLTLPHGYSLETMAAVRAQQQHLAAIHQQLMNYPTATFEAIWQRKLPTAPLAQPWAQKSQESLLAGDLAAMHREQMQLHIEQERRERERLEQERRERDRLEQERREKERKEMIERERLEKEKAEREKAERERQERERQERERQERERQEKERQEWEHKQNQERILKESVDTVAAVDQHFAESLTRLATQHGLAPGILPSISRGTGRGFMAKSEGQHSLPPHSLAYQEAKMMKREVDIPDDKRFVSKGGGPAEKSGGTFPGYPYNSGGGYPPSHKPVFNLYGYPSAHSTISSEQLKKQLIPESQPIKEEMVDKKMPYSALPSHAASPHHAAAGYLPKDLKPHNSVIVKRDMKSEIKMETPVAAHSHHNSPSSSSPRPQHPRPAHTPEHRPERPLSSSTSPASGIPPHLLHHSSSSPAGPPPPSHSTAFRAVEAHASRSQSPYKPAASQSQQSMPLPLDYHKASGPSKVKAGEPHPAASHPGYSTSGPAVPPPPPVSASSAALAYSYSLIQQGLVPNPIYSQGGAPHPSEHNSTAHRMPVPMAGMPQGGPKPQVSPPGMKRKPTASSKDPSLYNRKKLKGQAEAPGQAMSIPVTTPEILTNPSPYTTTSSSSVFSKPGSTSMSSASPSPSLSASFSSMNSGFMDNFKSFVENTVHIAFLQDEKKAQEKAERERVNNSAALAAGPVSTKFEPNLLERKSDCVPGGQPPAVVTSQMAATSAPSEVPPTSLNAESSYNSRIMDTINRVANNQVDTDSDTLSASSPPPQIKPSDTSSPLNRSGNSSGSSHPHHMKKAWLQRHDEDKKSETPVAPPPAAPAPVTQEEQQRPVTQAARDSISCVENSGATGEGGLSSLSSSPANVVVTLPNGNISDLNHRNDESTSSASEAEMQNSTKNAGSKKRVKSRKSGGSSAGAGAAKKAKAETEPESVAAASPSSAVSSNSNSSSSRKKTPASAKRGKTEKDVKAKEDSQQSKREDQALNSSKQSRDNSPQPSKLPERNTKAGSNATTTAASTAPIVSSPSPHSDRSNPSPTLSETNPTSTASSTSSSSSPTTSNSRLQNSSGANSKENKEKKKPRRSKEAASKDSSSFNKPLVKQTVATLKKTMVPFIQDGPCSEITPKLTKCRECKMTPVQRSKKQPNIFCRFYAFRRLKYSSRGIVTIDGFSELSDADPDDIEPWLPRYPVEEPDLDVENSKFIISKVGDKFCELVEQEKEAKSWAVKIAWKRAVQGVREMCDVCDTTLFNMHWVCQKCGFVVCLDCYKVRMKEGKKPAGEDKWLTCSSNRQAHEASKMMLTQIIPSDALWELGRLIHDIRTKWSIPSNCPCGGSNGKLLPKNGITQQILSVVNSRKLPNGVGSEELSGKSAKSKKQQDSGNPLKNLGNYNPDTSSSPLSILAEVASMEPDSNREKPGDQGKGKLDKTAVPGDEFLEESEKKSSCTSLRELLTKTAGKPKMSNEKKGKKGSGTNTLVHIIQSAVEKKCLDGGAPFKFMHYTPRLGGWKRELPIMVHSLTETSVLYPDIPHSWLCDGRLLRLHDAHHKGNLQIFQEQWKRGQPVLVSLANKQMNLNLWKPDVFSREFGDIENEVVNCRTGNVIIGHTMSDFWDGFEVLGNRPVDDKQEPMLLKLKDWPPGDDFSELLPTRFQDLMKALPLPEYTHRNGKLNLASRLPDFSVRPDLGPKMYNAYGSSHFPKEGTTNLHLDISDAVNVMVYVGIPGDGPGGRKAQEDAAVKAIDDAGCDSITKRRVREVHEIPGALWHIYDAHDADKIRDFLNKVAKERGESIEKDHDAIHDQSWYLDKELCDRLLKEYGVQGYTIVQCLGDAIFIPAGAPHQVRNLHSCIKVAEDFVSPEHLNHCFRLTQEFRQLSETHSNHEDKLQVKNIVYHAVKDAIAVLREHDPDDE
ncbi:probable JmjC domain-containing histone demethylation protein 2C [Aplysia californica]|uniref:Probable JmjC domain-containing histone demethylation protein 2C n=1 Tax=Aplysia californica TaxID=6500 RepID=A0ABM0JDF6_APLCA|nr:probable JmjC domain-containing histone demethylation protein 2C [Aplysia californica]